MMRTGASLGVGMGGALVLLDQAWYADYERSRLQSFNDGNEWQQMDKAGHIFSAYTLSSWGHALFQRCDPPGRKALWLGSGLGLAFMTGVELLDGTSAAWGFSWWDMAANVTGSGLYVGQELAWGEQRIRVKLSARQTDYAAMRPELLGEGAIERYLKDYNGQTSWLSTNLRSFAQGSSLPAWLNVAVGYSAVGMITAEPPSSSEELGGDLQRMRRFFLSPDIDLTRIKTRSKTLRTLLFVLNSIKIPAPTLEVTGTGKIQGHWLYF